LLTSPTNSTCPNYLITVLVFLSTFYVAAAVDIFKILLTTSVPFSMTTRGMKRIKMSNLDGQIFKITTGAIKTQVRLEGPFINKAMTYSTITKLYQHSQSTMKKLQV
jgi:hypothetical protein